MNKALLRSEVWPPRPKEAQGWAALERDGEDGEIVHSSPSMCQLCDRPGEEQSHWLCTEGTVSDCLDREGTSLVGMLTSRLPALVACKPSPIAAERARPEVKDRPHQSCLSKS